MATPAERQRRRRERLKAHGAIQILVTLSPEAQAALARLQERGLSQSQAIELALIQATAKPGKVTATREVKPDASGIFRA